MATTCDATTLVDDARCLVAAMNDRQLLASIVCLLATQLDMSCDATTLIANSKCLWMGMGDRQLLAAAVYLLCSGGVPPVPSALWTLGTTDPPPSDGSVLTPFARSVTNVKYANIGTVAAPDWDQI